MATEKQIEANRQNAQFSTGPRDTAKTSKNAKKYGIFSKEMVVNCKFFQENTKQFYHILVEFEQEYNPETITEWILLEEAVDAYWRLKRIRNARQAKIIEHLESAEFEAGRFVDHRDEYRRLSCEMSYGPFRYWPHPDIEKKMGEVNNKIAKLCDDKMTDEEMNEELKNGWWDNTENEDISTMPLERKKQILFVALEEELGFFENPYDMKAKEKKEVEKLKQAAFLIREDVNWENLSAYETTLERKFYRAITALRRMKGMPL